LCHIITQTTDIFIVESAFKHHNLALNGLNQVSIFQHLESESTAIHKKLSSNWRPLSNCCWFVSDELLVYHF